MAYKFQFNVSKCVFAPGASLTVSQPILAMGLKKVFCVYDKGIKSVGLVDPIVAALKDAGLEVAEFDGVAADPSDTLINEAGKLAHDFGAQAIVAIGGGSSIDTAKGVSVLAVNEGPVSKYYSRAPIPNLPAPIFAIPTTSGTGSETTPMSVISDTAAGRKISIFDAKVIPLYAYMDPLLTLGLPAGLTAATGMDAFAHAFEGMTCVMQNPLTNAIGLGAIKLIVKNLPICVKDGKNEDARSAMQLASTMAGISFGNSLVHVGHGLAHGLGAAFHIPHGVGCAWGLPFSARILRGHRHEQVLEVAEAVGLENAASLAPEELSEAMANWLEAFCDSVGIPTLRDMKLTPDDFEKAVAAIAAEKGLLSYVGLPVSEDDIRDHLNRMFSK